MITAETFQQAIEYSVAAHKNQYRKGDGRPYILHPINVMNNISRVKKDSKNVFLLATAAILHDVVEDCFENMTREGKLRVIATKFGHQVASIVDELTLDKTQCDKIGKTNYLCQEVLKMSSYALAIKLCDRLDNVSDLDKMDMTFVMKYKTETNEILRALEKRSKLTSTHKKLIKLIKKKL